jgi:hypothetical protein
MQSTWVNIDTIFLIIWGLKTPQYCRSTYFVITLAMWSTREGNDLLKYLL